MKGKGPRPTHAAIEGAGKLCVGQDEPSLYLTAFIASLSISQGFESCPSFVTTVFPGANP